MSRVHPKQKEIFECCSRISHYSQELFLNHNSDYKWYSFVSTNSWDQLIMHRYDWRAAMIAYFTRLTTYKYKMEQEQNYRQLMIEIVKLIELLDD